MTTSNQTHKSIFDQFVLVDLNFKAYSATISLSKTGLLEKDVPKDLVTSGNLKLVSPQRLKAFATLRSQARTACLKHGTGYMSLYMVPVKYWPKLKDELQDIVIKFNDEAICFRNDYSTFVEEFAQKAEQKGNHKIAAAMRNCQHEKSWVSSRFSATFGAGFFTHAPGIDTAAADMAVKETLKENILNDISVLATNAIRGYVSGASAITRRLVTSTLQGVVDKLEGLSFVDQSLEVLKDTLIKYAAAFDLPEKGNLPTTKQSQVATLFLTMKDPDNLPDLANILKKQIEDLRLSVIETAPAVEAVPVVETVPAIEAVPTLDLSGIQIEIEEDDFGFMV